MEIVWVDHNDIKPYAKNPRNNEKTLDSLSESLERYGWQQPVVVDKNGVIIVGHTRYEAAVKLGWNDIPVVYADELSDDQSKAYRIMDNKTHDYSRWDIEVLKTELESIEDVEHTAFSLKELDDVMYPELGLIGNKTKKNDVKHRVIVELKDKASMEELESELNKEGYVCQTRYY